MGIKFLKKPFPAANDQDQWQRVSIDTDSQTTVILKKSSQHVLRVYTTEIQTATKQLQEPVRERSTKIIGLNYLTCSDIGKYVDP